MMIIIVNDHWAFMTSTFFKKCINLYFVLGNVNEFIAF